MLTYPPPFAPSAGVIDDVCGLPLSRFTVPSKQRQLFEHTFCMDWSDDGAYLYTGLAIHRAVLCNKTTGNPWEIDEQVRIGNFNPDADVEQMQNTVGIWVRPDGTELWINGYTGSGIGSTVQYSLTVPYEWDNTVPPKIGSISNGKTEFRHANELNIKGDGTKIITWGNDGNQFPYQQEMAAWDVTTLVYGPDNKVITATDCFVPKSGTCLYMIAGRVINKYAFGTPWELTTLGNTILDSKDLTADVTANIMAMFITATRLFVIDDNDIIYQYNA